MDNQQQRNNQWCQDTGNRWSLLHCYLKKMSNLLPQHICHDFCLVVFYRSFTLRLRSAIVLDHPQEWQNRSLLPYLPQHVIPLDRADTSAFILHNTEPTPQHQMLVSHCWWSLLGFKRWFCRECKRKPTFSNTCGLLHCQCKEETYLIFTIRLLPDLNKGLAGPLFYNNPA